MEKVKFKIEVVPAAAIMGMPEFNGTRRIVLAKIKTIDNDPTVISMVVLAYDGAAFMEWVTWRAYTTPKGDIDFESGNYFGSFSEAMYDLGERSLIFI